MADVQPLRVIIIGAGIGGLMTAISLRSQGHEVTIYEKSSMTNEKGVAISLQPNATKLLRHYGLDVEEFGGTAMQGMTMRDGATLSIMMEISEKVTEVTTSKDREQASYFVHRADLHRALKDVATGKGVLIHPNSIIQSISEQTNTIILQDGTSVEGDLIVGADGVHSWTRKQVFGESHQEQPSALGCFRFLVPTSALAQDSSTKVFVEKPGIMMDLVGPDRRIILYPCSGGDYINVLAIVPGQIIEEGGEKRERLLTAFDKFDASAQQLVDKSIEEEINTWPLFDMPPMPVWVRGRVVLVGDAAHPFTPFLAQGACSALEDGVSLGAFLPSGTAPALVGSRLLLFERCRKARVDRIQELSRIRGRDASGKRESPPTGDDLVNFVMYCKMHDELEYSTKFLEVFGAPTPMPPMPPPPAGE